MSYQQSGYQYSNVPPSDGGNSNSYHNGYTSTDDPLSNNNTAAPNAAQQPEQMQLNPNGSQPNQPPQNVGIHPSAASSVSSYATAAQSAGPARAYLPTYHDYNMPSSNNNESASMGNFGTYGPNFGSVEWADTSRRNKRNRIMVGLVVGIFLLMLITHPAHPKGDITVGVNHAGPRGPDIDNEPGGEEVGGEEKPPPPPPPPINHHHHNGESLLPTISYLLTYPMSGTSFTMELISETTDTTLATNYDFVVYRDDEDNPRPICDDYKSMMIKDEAEVKRDRFSSTKTGFPFWSDTYGETKIPSSPQPNILTLSHCSGHCLPPCPPDQYLTTSKAFEESCRMIYTRNSTNTHDPIYHTPKKYMNKIIHLFRDPYSNIVSRFHEALFQEIIELRPIYDNTPDGFKSWCQDMDSNNEILENEKTTPFLSSRVKDQLESVPCHSEFIKYVSWHNHVVEMSWDGSYPVEYVYFEDYKNEPTQEAAARHMADFLGYKFQEQTKRLMFNGGNMYRDEYYTKEQQLIIKEFIRSMALTKTWSLLENRYLKDIL